MELVLLAAFFFPSLPVSGKNVPLVPLHTDSGVGDIIKNLPCPSGMQAVAQLSGRIPVAQYGGTGGEGFVSTMRDVFIDGVNVKTCRAPRPAGKWQTTYHSVVVRATEFTPEYGRRALGGVVALHRTRVQSASETPLESPGGQSAPESQAVAVTGRFVRSGGDVDNVHLYHFVYRNTVNWILIQAVSPLLPLNVVPDADSWRLVQGMHAELGKLR